MPEYPALNTFASKLFAALATNRSEGCAKDDSTNESPMQNMFFRFSRTLAPVRMNPFSSVFNGYSQSAIEPSERLCACSDGRAGRSGCAAVLSA